MPKAATRLRAYRELKRLFDWISLAGLQWEIFSPEQEQQTGAGRIFLLLSAAPASDSFNEESRIQLRYSVRKTPPLNVL